MRRGDLVRCINPSDRLNRGSMYVINESYPEGCVSVIGVNRDDGEPRKFFNTRFELVEERQPEPPPAEEQRSETFYIVRWSEGPALFRKIFDSSAQATRLLESLGRDPEATVLYKKKITVKF